MTGPVVVRAGGPRLAWVDVVKGVAIVLVVQYHAALRLDPTGVVPAWVDHGDYVLAQVRMPLLFLASGLFAARTTSGPWGVLLHKRIAHYAWLYALWCVLYASYLHVAPVVVREPALTSWPTLLEWTVLPPGVLWFVYGLALFSVLVRVMAPLPVAVQLTAAAALSAAVSSGRVQIPADAWHLMATSFVFFVLGVRGSGWVRAVAEGATWPRVTGLAVTAIGLELAAGAWDLRSVPGVELVTSALLVATAIGACVLVSRRRLGRAAAWLGERTLPVYLLHMFLLGAAVTPLVRDGARPVVGVPPLVGAGATAVLTAVAVGLSLVLHHGLRTVGAGWLFALPRRWAWRPDRVPARRARHRWSP